MLKLIRLGVIGIITLIISPLAFAAGTGSEGYFEIHNNTSANTVVGFYTNDGGGWSANWLEERLDSGQSAVARFDAETGSCQQTLRVGWLGDDLETEVLDQPINIDICDATNVYLGDNEITYD